MCFLLCLAGHPDQTEMLCELLGLKAVVPLPQEYIKVRKEPSKATQHLIHRLRRAVEKECLQGGRLRQIWGGYDHDGSGKISYDEVHATLIPCFGPSSV